MSEISQKKISKNVWEQSFYFTNTLIEVLTCAQYLIQAAIAMLRVNKYNDFVIDMIACITQSPSNERERERKDRKRTSLVRQPEFTLLFYQHLMII